MRTRSRFLFSSEIASAFSRFNSRKSNRSFFNLRILFACIIAGSLLPATEIQAEPSRYATSINDLNHPAGQIFGDLSNLLGGPQGGGGAGSLDRAVVRLSWENHLGRDPSGRPASAQSRPNASCYAIALEGQGGDGRGASANN